MCVVSTAQHVREFPKTGLSQKQLLNIFPSNTSECFKYFEKFTNQRGEIH